MQVFKSISVSFEALLQEITTYSSFSIFAASRSALCCSPSCAMKRTVYISILILFHQCVHTFVEHFISTFTRSPIPASYWITEFQFCFYLVVPCYRHPAHVITKATEFSALLIIPACGSTQPCSHAPVRFFISCQCPTTTYTVWSIRLTRHSQIPRSPCADWFRFIKSISIVPREYHDWTGVRCRNNGFCKIFSPLIHIWQEMRIQVINTYATLCNICSGTIQRSLRVFTTICTGSCQRHPAFAICCVQWSATCFNVFSINATKQNQASSFFCRSAIY